MDIVGLYFTIILQWRRQKKNFFENLKLQLQNVILNQPGVAVSVWNAIYK